MLAGTGERGNIDFVEAAGPSRTTRTDHQQVPGRPTRSYRSRHALRVVGEIVDRQGHEPEVLSKMLTSLAVLRDVIED